MAERALRDGRVPAGGYIAVLPGDGIGPEVVNAALRVLETVAADLRPRYETITVGGAAIDAYGTPLRPEDLERCRAADAVVLGAVGGPTWDHLPPESRPERALLQLRSGLGLGINLRPVVWTAAGAAHSPLKPEVAADTNIAFVRELTGGVYFGKPSFSRRGVSVRYAVDTARYTESQILTVLEFAFELARGRRGRIVSVDKANVMRTSRLWRDIASEYGRLHPDVELEHALVDSFAMSLMQDPRRYDVVVTENLFGDILTDLAGVIAGSLGVLPSASLRPGQGREPSTLGPKVGAGFGMYEPIHGSAPDIAGRNAADPVGAILSVALMLEWSLHRPDLAQLIRAAVTQVMAAGILTNDLATDGDGVTTTAFTDAVIAALHDATAAPLASGAPARGDLPTTMVGS